MLRRRLRATGAPNPAPTNADPTSDVSYIEIRQGILRSDFVLEFQPKVSLRSGLIESVEALVRWQHPMKGRLSPDRFLPEAERTALMGRLTKYVIEHAVASCLRFHDRGVLLGVGVNISPSSLNDVTLPYQVAEILTRRGLHPSWLTLEVTQSAGIADFRRASSILRVLGSTGVHLSLDDFGTGEFSQAFLEGLPVDELKIDRALIARAATSPVDAGVVRAAVETGHALHMRVVAEGVEDKETLTLMHVLKVDAAQGYFLSPPVEADRFVERFHAIASAAQAVAFSPSIDLRDIARSLDEVAPRVAEYRRP